MKIYSNEGDVKRHSFLVQVPANQLLGRVKSNYSLNSPETSFEEFISYFLNGATATITLVDNFKSVQEVMATKVPLAFFNDMSSMGEGAVVHGFGDKSPDEDNKLDIMFKIPLAYSGSLDLNSQKYLRVDLDFEVSQHRLDKPTTGSEYDVNIFSVEVYARQTRALTNELIQYKRLNVPDGVLTYEFNPDGGAYIVLGTKGVASAANIDFVELVYNTGVTSRVDFYELLAKYYEENEISSRFVSGFQMRDISTITPGVTPFEASILALESVGVSTIRIVRNNTEDDTTIICLSKYVSSASDNRISNGSVTKAVTGEYVPATPAVVAENQLITLLEPKKPYAVANIISTAVNQLPNIAPTASGVASGSLKGVGSQALGSLGSLFAQMK